MMVFHVVSAYRQALVKPQFGHRCVTHTEVYTDISGISWQLCIWYCLKHAHCGVINYDVNTRLCRRSQETCQYFHRDAGYAALAMNLTETCLRWVSLNNVDLNDAISSPSPGDGIKQFVVRGISNGNVIPGKYANGVGYYIVEGAEVTFNEPEFLVVRDGCTIDWVTYDSSSSDPFPAAIIGGWLQGKPVYVARKYQVYETTDVEALSVGYYDKASDIGHMGWGGNDVTMPDVELLVLENWEKKCLRWTDYMDLYGTNVIALWFNYIR